MARPRPPLRALLAEPTVSLPVFAARHLGSAYALDDGTALATPILSGVRALSGYPDGTGAQWRRDAWASAGLLRDELSSTVLALNLRGTPALDWVADAGEPTVLTLRHWCAVRPPPRPGQPARARYESAHPVGAPGPGAAGLGRAGGRRRGSA